MRKDRLSLLFLVAALACFLQIPTVASSTVAQTESITLANGEVTLVAPYEIEETLMYKDGGTIGIVIKDANGILLPVCYDQRIKVPEDNRFLYVGATHPSTPPAVKVNRGSDTEQALLRILSSAEIKNPSPRIRQDLVDTVVNKLRGGKKVFLR